MWAKPVFCWGVAPTSEPHKLVSEPLGAVHVEFMISFILLKHFLLISTTRWPPVDQSLEITSDTKFHALHESWLKDQSSSRGTFTWKRELPNKLTLSWNTTNCQDLRLFVRHSFCFHWVHNPSQTTMTIDADSRWSCQTEQQLQSKMKTEPQESS